MTVLSNLNQMRKLYIWDYILKEDKYYRSVRMARLQGRSSLFNSPFLIKNYG